MVRTQEYKILVRVSTLTYPVVIQGILKHIGRIEAGISDRYDGAAPRYECKLMCFRIQWAVGIVGNTVALQASVPGSIPGRSTILWRVN